MDNPVSNIIDKQFRQITIGGNGINIVAEHNGNEIGVFDFDELEGENNSSTILTNCNIESDYQRSGIGIEMIKLAEEWYDEFCIVDHLSIEGADFINYCRQNVFKLNHSLIKDDRF